MLRSTAARLLPLSTTVPSAHTGSALTLLHIMLSAMRTTVVDSGTLFPGECPPEVASLVAREIFTPALSSEMGVRVLRSRNWADLDPFCAVGCLSYLE